MNTYGYVGGNPNKWTDPRGLNAGAGAVAVGIVAICARSPRACRAAIAAIGTGIGNALCAITGMCNESSEDSEGEGESCPTDPPDIDDFDDPENLPEGWDWRGNGEPGSRDGAYHNPDTGESLHDDRTHPPGRDPHTTYTDPKKLKGSKLKGSEPFK